MFSYSWGDLVAVSNRFSKGLPAQTVNAQICDFVSQEMYVSYPWKQTITNTASAKIPLVDSVQDYSVEAPNIFRPLKAWFRRTDVLPIQTRDLEIKKDLSVSLTPISWQGIRVVSLQQSVGLFRLESAVQIPAGTQIELCFDFQANPIKVEGLNQIIWFDDRYAVVAMKGILYWIYKLGDDQARAQTQYMEFMDSLSKMKAAEEFGYTESVFPADVMGEGRDWTSYWIVG